MPGRNFPPRINPKAPAIRKLLKETTLSLREIARQTGVTHPYVSKLALREGLRPKRVYIAYANPWNLSSRQYETLLRLTEHGLLKQAADKMGVSKDTLEATLHAAKRKIGESNRTLAILKFDRWYRGANV
jgi:DNA-binding CsgD family transcriptional regulator